MADDARRGHVLGTAAVEIDRVLQRAARAGRALAVAREIVELGEQRGVRSVVGVRAELDRVDPEVPAPVAGGQCLGVERSVGKPGDRVDLVVLDVDRDVAGDVVATHGHVAPVAEILRVAEPRADPLAVGRLARCGLAVDAQEAVRDTPGPEVGPRIERVDRRVVGLRKILDVVDRAARLAGRGRRRGVVEEQPERVRIARLGEAERLLGAVAATAGGERERRDERDDPDGAGTRHAPRPRGEPRVHGNCGREIGGDRPRAKPLDESLSNTLHGEGGPVGQKLKLVVSSRRLRS